MINRIAYIVAALFAGVALVIGVLALYLVVGFHSAVAKTDGTMRLPGLHAPVTIVRDERDIPHISARNEHDLFEAQGFVEGSDRLFQIDLTRHAVYGRLAEWFGGRALQADERARIVNVRGIVNRQFAKLTPPQQDELQAFSDGVNAAMQSQPLPFEYRLLFMRPAMWKPQDSLAVGFATVLVLSDSYRDVLQRDAIYFSTSRSRPVSANQRAQFNAFYPLTDPRYDSPTADLSGRPGSNAWAAGALHSLTGHALLANDPHLAPSIPGIWYLIDLHAPGYHAAGASLAGTPGIILGHNDAIAWGATNGSVAAQSVFCGMSPRRSESERFFVRFRNAVSQPYFRERRGFYVSNPSADRTERSHESCLVAWSAYTNPRSPLTTFDGLDRADSIESGRRALSKYPGPTQNFVLAQSDGRVAYQLAGWIPNDPAWGRYAHRSGYRDYGPLPFNVLPHVAASRSALVWTANNKMYGKNYPYRLGASFEPPYRAFRIKTLLQKQQRYDVGYFTEMQADVYSVPDLEFVKKLNTGTSQQNVSPDERALLSAVAKWDGRFEPQSVGATIAHDIRVDETSSPFGGKDLITSVLQDLRAPQSSQQEHDTLQRAFDCPTGARAPCVRNVPWGDAGAVTIHHPLHGLGINWLDGPTLPGDGDKYTLHVQREAFTQSLRAVWDAGDWDAGGITIPCGESGEPASAHYQDLSRDWIANRLVALPFSASAVQRHAVSTQTLLPWE
ncbi:MAG: penicillin acylase family protein [Candidatus Eremiobacteraeota bacterium]|nr:penicillin acylase family protein [Candidatus Eremiobacteraeota bacterium]